MAKQSLKSLEIQVENTEKAVEIVETITEEEKTKLKALKKQEKQEKKRLKKIQEIANSIKEDLTSQLQLQDKNGQHFTDLVKDYVYFYTLKEDLKHDIDKNGLRIEQKTGNGYTTEKENKSVELLVKVNTQMLKILQDLDLKVPDVLSSGGTDKDGDAEYDLL